MRPLQYAPTFFGFQIGAMRRPPIGGTTELAAAIRSGSKRIFEANADHLGVHQV